MSLYKGCKTALSVNGQQSSSFSVKVCVCQVHALSPLLNALTEDVKHGS